MTAQTMLSQNPKFMVLPRRRRHKKDGGGKEKHRKKVWWEQDHKKINEPRTGRPG